jgi:hypothetical protein
MPLTLTTGADPTLTYDDFLKEKVRFDRSFGFEVPDSALSPIFQPDHPNYKPHQAAIVHWAVAGGRRAIFARYGLGKSVMQLEILRLIVKHAHDHGQRDGFGIRTRRGLIVAPLGVRFDIIADGRNLLDMEVRFIRTTAEIDPDWAGVYVTNYESVRDGKIDVDLFTGVSLDEAAVLRSFGSETYQRLVPMFENVPFRFVATATPSPNRHKELIHYAGFLGVMDTGQALTRFFQRDSSNAGNLTLYPHKRREFWLWLNTWACFIQRPSDLGFSDAGYDLPPLNVIWEEVSAGLLSTKVERDGQGVLVRGGAMSAVDAAREKRHTLEARIGKAMAIVDAHWYEKADEQIILWCDLNDEQDALEAGLAERNMLFSSIHGSLTDEQVEERLADWLAGRTFALIGKPSMLGRGLNLQQCSMATFVGITHKYEQTIQAVHRIHRFGQTRQCDVHLIYAETESEVRANLETKWAEDDALTETMSEVLREFGLSASAISTELTRAMGVQREVFTGDAWTIALNDSIDEWARLDPECMGLIVTSIPFGNHYEYSPNYADFGHTDDNDHFWWQNDYLTPSLYRALKPGRILAVHVKDRMLFGSVTGKGVYTVSPLHAEAIAHYTGHGFDYYGMITVTTDVVRENNQSYRLSYSKMLRDHTPMGVGSPEYVLLFHKPQTGRAVGWADERVVKNKADYSVGQWQIDASADWRTGGDRLLTLDELMALDPGTRSRLFTEQTRNTVYDYDAHVALAERMAAVNALPGTFASLVPGSPRPDVWTDILRIETLNSKQRARQVANHICPFPLEIPRRLITMYSNPGELVGDSFSGLGSTGLEAVKQGRRYFGSELNPTSVADSVTYLREFDNARAVPTLFDLLDAEAVAS